ARESNAAQAVALPLFDRDTNIDALTLARPEGKEREPTFIADTRDGIGHPSPEIPAILQRAANPLGIFLELAGIVGAGEDVLQEDRVRNPDRPQVSHGRAQLARRHSVIPGKAN